MRRFLAYYKRLHDGIGYYQMRPLMGLTYLQYRILIAQCTYIEIMDSEYRFCKYHRLITSQGEILFFDHRWHKNSQKILWIFISPSPILKYYRKTHTFIHFTNFVYHSISLRQPEKVKSWNFFWKVTSFFKGWPTPRLVSPLGPLGEIDLHRIYSVLHSSRRRFTCSTAILPVSRGFTSP